jgi:hypothetical protein
VRAAGILVNRGHSICVVQAEVGCAHKAKAQECRSIVLGIPTIPAVEARRRSTHWFPRTGKAREVHVSEDD